MPAAAGGGGGSSATRKKRKPQQPQASPQQVQQVQHQAQQNASRTRVVAAGKEIYLPEDQKLKKFRQAGGHARTPTVDQAQERAIADFEGQAMQRAINQRAKLLDPRLRADNPTMAATLITGGTPTHQLGDLSASVYEGANHVKGQYGEFTGIAQSSILGIDDAAIQDIALSVLKSYHRFDATSQAVVIAGGDDKATAALFTTISSLPARLYDAAGKRGIATFLGQFLTRATASQIHAFITAARDKDRDAVEAVIDEAYGGEAPHTGTEGINNDALVDLLTGHQVVAEADMMNSGSLAALGGLAVTALGTPFVAAGWAGGIALRKVHAEGISLDIKSVQEGLAQTGQRIIRGAEVVPEGLATLTHDWVTGHGEKVTQHLKELSRSAWDLDARHGPSARLAIQMGMDPDDPMLDVIDGVVDTAVGFVLFDAAAKVKAAHYEPAEYAGEHRFLVRKTTEAWTKTRDAFRVGSQVIKANLETDGSAGALINRFGFNTELAESLRGARTLTEFKRAIIGHAEGTVGLAKRFAEEYAKVQDIETRLAADAEATAKAAARKARPIPEGHETYYHETSAENLRGIREGGVEARGGTSHGEARAQNVHAWSEEGIAGRIQRGEIPEGDVIVEFTADPASIRGRGTSGDILGSGGYGESPHVIFNESVPAERITAIYDRTGTRNLLDTAADQAGVDFLKAERVAALDRIEKLNAAQVFDRFPHVSETKFWLDKMPGKSRLAGYAKALTDKSALLNPKNFANDTPRRIRLTSPVKATSAQMARNYEMVGKFLRVARVSTENIELVFDSLAKVKSRQGFFDWYRRDLIPTIADALERNRPLEPLMQEQLYSAIKVDPIEATRTPIVEVKTATDGTTFTKTRNALVDADGNAIPTRPSQFVDDITLPDIEMVADAARVFRLADKLPPNIRPKFEAAGWAMHLPSRLITTAWKGATLSLGVGRLIERSSLEQMMRSIYYGDKPLAVRSRLMSHADILPGGTPIAEGSMNRLMGTDILPEEGPAILGTLLGDEFAEGETITQWVHTDNMHPGGGATPAQIHEVSRSIAQSVQDAARDPLTVMLARDGVDATLGYLETRPETTLGRWYERDMRGHLENHGYTPRQWLLEEETHLRQITGGDPALYEAIHSGRYDVGKLVDATEEGFKRNAIQEADNQILEAKRIRDHDALREAREEKARLGSTLRSRTERSIGLEDIDDLAHAIKQSDIYEFPEQVRVHRRVAPQTEDGFRAKFDAKFEKMTAALYRPLQLWGKADVLATRGSMYYQEYARTYKRLVDQGWPETRAMAEAQYKAGYLTNERMYDLAAKSSFDRSMKHIFPFSAAAREIGTTWLLNIPSRAGLPLGLPLLFGTGRSVNNLLKDLGVITEHDYGDGNIGHTIRIPGMDNFLGHFMLDLNVESLTSISPIQSGDGPPTPVTFSPFSQWTTERLAEHIPAFEALDNFFAFDPGHPEFWPRQLKDIYHIATGQPWYFDVSNEVDIARVDRAHDKGIQVAYQEMVKDGKLMPQPTEFKTDAAYDAAIKKWQTELNSRADSITRGIFAADLMGHTIFPATVSVVSPVKAAFDDWKDKEGLEYPYTDADYQAIDGYVKQHPEAFPYTVSYYQPTGYDNKSVPEDANFFEKLEGGEIISQDPKDYQAEIEYRASMAYEYRLLASDLKKVGLGPGYSASESLFKAREYNEAMDAHRKRMHNFESMNLEAAAWGENNSDLMDKLYGEPVLTKRQETLFDTYNLLNANSAWLTGVGKKATDDAGNVMRKIAEKLQFPEPDTKVGRQRAWYFETKLGPYLEKVTATYDQIDKLKDEGKEGAAGKLYDTIRDLADDFGPTRQFGQKFPGVEEYLYGLKSTKDQAAQRVGWSTKPVMWLTDFQLGQAGYQDFKGRAAFLRDTRKIDQAFGKEYYVDGISDARQASLIRQRDEAFRLAARPYGDRAQKMVPLLTASPVVRLKALGFGANDKGWQRTTEQARSITASIENHGDNPGYDGEFAMRLKVPFLREVENRRRQDPAYDKLWDDLSAANPDKTDVELYVAILFNQWGSKWYDPAPLTRAVEGH